MSWPQCPVSVTWCLGTCRERLETGTDGPGTCTGDRGTCTRNPATCTEERSCPKEASQNKLIFVIYLSWLSFFTV